MGVIGGRGSNKGAEVKEEGKVEREGKAGEA